MKLERETVRQLRGLILFAVAAGVIGINYRFVWQLLKEAGGILTPFALGAAIAFVLNVPMRVIEEHLPEKMGKSRRPVSLMMAILLVVGLVLTVTLVVTPQLVKTLMELQKGIPVFFGELQTSLVALFAENPDISAMIAELTVDWKQVFTELANFLGNGASSLLNLTVNLAMALVSGFATGFIALIFALYILLQKETLARQFGKLNRAFMPAGVVKGLPPLLSFAENTFAKFLTGQCVEAVILGTMFVVVLTLFRIPYAMLIGVLIAFTALIPVFGAFVGCGVGAFLVLTVDPVKALYFVVIFLILQQIEGNLIYPHVVGGSVGLPSIWVLTAVTVGGSAFGVVGMLVFIPLCSVLYAVLRAVCNKRIAARTDLEE